MRFPPMAIASILHRVSGIILFLLLPYMLYFLGQSLQSEEAFMLLKMQLAAPGYKLVLWAFSAALTYHILAGIRHILMDIGWGEHLDAGRRSAVLVIAVSIILTLFLGIWIW